MDSKSIGQLLSSFKEECSPFVKLRRVDQGLINNILELSKRDHVEVKEESEDYVIPGLCQLCESHSKNFKQRNLGCEMLMEYFKVISPQLLEALLFCDDCAAILDYMMDQHKQILGMRRRLENLAAAIETVLRVTGRIYKEENSNDLTTIDIKEDDSDNELNTSPEVVSNPQDLLHPLQDATDSQVVREVSNSLALREPEDPDCVHESQDIPEISEIAESETQQNVVGRNLNTRENCVNNLGDSQKEHAIDELNPDAYACQTCQLSFSRKSKLQFHQKMVHGEMQKEIEDTDDDDFEGEISSEPSDVEQEFDSTESDKSEDESAFDNADKTHGSYNRDSYTCPACENNYKTLRQLQEHFRYSHSGSPCKCPHCEESFSTVALLIRHEEMTHMKGVYTFKCKKCDSRYKRQDHLNRHLRNHAHTISNQSGNNIPPNTCLQQSATELETVSATFVEEVEVLPSINASGTTTNGEISKMGVFQNEKGEYILLKFVMAENLAEAETSASITQEMAQSFSLKDGNFEPNQEVNQEPDTCTIDLEVDNFATKANTQNTNMTSLHPQVNSGVADQPNVETRGTELPLTEEEKKRRSKEYTQSMPTLVLVNSNDPQAQPQCTNSPAVRSISTTDITPQESKKLHETPKNEELQNGVSQSGSKTEDDCNSRKDIEYEASSSDPGSPSSEDEGSEVEFDNSLEYNESVTKKLGNNRRKRKPSPNQWKCPSCDASFIKKVALIRHFSKEHHGEKYTCKQCGKKYNKYESLMYHKRRIHQGEEDKFVCDRCGKRFFWKTTLRTHIRLTHETVRVFDCKKCPETFSNHRTYIEHNEVVHMGLEPSAFVCQECPAYYRTFHRFENHNKKNHGHWKPTECSICGKRFTKENAFLNHIHSDDGKIAYKCPQCSKTYTAWSLVELHIKTDHEGAVVIKKLHPGICQICGKFFKSKSTIHSHMRSVHSRDENGKPVCLKCGKSFSSLLARNIHERTEHWGLKEIRCYFCSKEFSSLLYLERHFGKHTTEVTEELKCPVCKKYFSSKPTLQIHIALVCGSDEQKRQEVRKRKRESMANFRKKKVYKCQKCGKGYGQKPMLVSHEKRCE